MHVRLLGWVGKKEPHETQTLKGAFSANKKGMSNGRMARSAVYCKEPCQSIGRAGAQVHSLGLTSALVKSEVF